MLYGVDFRSVETSLPVSIKQRIPGSRGTRACKGYDYPSLWQSAGYTRTKVENALFAMEGCYQSAFPNTQLLPTRPRGFPPIDENGNLLRRQAVDFQVPKDLMSDGASTLGEQFAAGNGALGTNGLTWPLLTEFAAAVDTGYQTLSTLGARSPKAMHWRTAWVGDVSNCTRAIFSCAPTSQRSQPLLTNCSKRARAAGLLAQADLDSYAPLYAIDDAVAVAIAADAGRLNRDGS